MHEAEPDFQKGLEVAAQLRELGVRGILITAASQGHITELKCAMPTCHCPEELGGKSHFVNVPESLPEWMPSVDHIQPRKEGGKLTIGNVRLAHRLCNRVHHAESEGLSTNRDRQKVEAARQEAIERSTRPLLLKTGRLELRPSLPEFFDEIWAAIQSSLSELKPWLPWAVEPWEEDTRVFLQHSAHEWESGRDRHFSVFMDGSYCGNCSLMRVDPAHMSAELGYWMRSDLCRNNLMTEAAYEVVSFGFWQEGLHRIELQAGVENQGSIRVAEKLGFQREGTLRHGGRGANGFYDSYVYGLLKTDPRADPGKHNS